jgi:hypothetical protein
MTDAPPHYLQDSSRMVGASYLLDIELKSEFRTATVLKQSSSTLHQNLSCSATGKASHIVSLQVVTDILSSLSSYDHIPQGTRISATPPLISTQPSACIIVTVSEQKLIWYLIFFPPSQSLVDKGCPQTQLRTILGCFPDLKCHLM